MKKIVKDFFLKPLKLNFVNIILIILLVYISNLMEHRNPILLLFILRLVALIIDYYTKNPGTYKDN